MENKHVCAYQFLNSFLPRLSTAVNGVLSWRALGLVVHAQNAETGMNVAPRSFYLGCRRQKQATPSLEIIASTSITLIRTANGGLTKCGRGGMKGSAARDVRGGGRGSGGRGVCVCACTRVCVRTCTAV